MEEIPNNFVPPNTIFKKSPAYLKVQDFSLERNQRLILLKSLLNRIVISDPSI